MHAKTVQIKLVYSKIGASEWDGHLEKCVALSDMYE